MVKVAMRRIFIQVENVVMPDQHSTTFYDVWRAKNASAFQKTAALNAIVEAAPQREDNTQPHGDFSQPIAALSYGKEFKRLGQVATRAQVHQACNAVGELHGCLPFAALVGCHDLALFNGKLTQTCYQELAEKDDDGNPEGAHANG